VFTADGRDLSGTLHARGSSYLDEDARGTGMRRRLLMLSFRRRLLFRVLPGALLWAAVFALLVGVVGLSLGVVLAISLAALAVQGLVLWTAARRR
jgi:esterase/lipase